MDGNQTRSKCPILGTKSDRRYPMHVIDEEDWQPDKVQMPYIGCQLGSTVSYIGCKVGQTGTQRCTQPWHLLHGSPTGLCPILVAKQGRRYPIGWKGCCSCFHDPTNQPYRGCHGVEDKRAPARNVAMHASKSLGLTQTLIYK
jgi:hypothetical protein